MSHVSRPNRGFTLVELVLAIGMFSFLMASVGHLVLMSLRVQRSWGQLVGPAQSAERALTRLAQDLQAAQPFFAIPFQVTGGGTGLEFTRPATVAGPDGQLVTEWLRIAYRLDRDGEDTVLMRDEWVWSADPEGREPRRHETLTRLASARFSVGVRTADQLEWRSSWDGQADGIPRLVQLEATLPSAGTGTAIALNRVVRNPAGALPEEEQP